MFVVSADFNRLPFNISGIAKVGQTDFSDFVNYYEEKKLRELLGNKFYDAMVTGVTALPPVYDAAHAYNLNDLVTSGGDIYKSLQAVNTGHLVTDVVWWAVQPVNRWLRLREGDGYLYYNRPQKWYGMKRLVTPLIYSLWTKYTYDNQTAQGVVVSKNENSVTVSPAVRIARAMNEYARLCAGDWPNVVSWENVIWPELENSLFGYLYMSPDTWDDLFVGDVGFGSLRAYLAYSFQYPGKTNVFGL